jgi:3',5'-cyclic AMP phosphodiesterase CpdA
MDDTAQLWAVSDLHVSYEANRELVRDRLKPSSPDDWLIVAGDIGERVADISWTLELLAGRFAQVFWSPGNHELWTPEGDAGGRRGVARYEHLVELCRGFGVLTPEDPYAVWTGAGGPVRVAPLFVGYDYTFLPAGTSTKAQGLAYARSTGVVCTDESLLHPDPYPDRDSWCRDRVALTERRLAQCDPEIPLILVNHYPLVHGPVEILWYPEFAMWCGTTATADWHRRFRVAAMIYGHLHIPRTSWYDGVRFEEVSLGYPREWQARPKPPALLREVLPTAVAG